MIAWANGKSFSVKSWLHHRRAQLWYRADFYIRKGPFDSVPAVLALIASWLYCRALFYLASTVIFSQNFPPKRKCPRTRIWPQRMTRNKEKSDCRSASTLEPRRWRLYCVEVRNKYLAHSSSVAESVKWIFIHTDILSKNNISSKHCDRCKYRYPRWRYLVAW